MKGKSAIELLSPARTAGSGIIAVNYGADAVYIGAPQFGARAAAGNSIADIERLTTYAHKYRARVYAALNTILFDNELEKARSIIFDLYNAGIDALIIQDMGIAAMDLPPIEIHASTQANNFDVSRIRFFEETGFSRVILARELSLEQIREIGRNTKLELEFFVHGALCVSMSGRCYLSEALGGRSGNRGICAQPCRKMYDLTDGNGQIIEAQKHLLSLKDLDLSGSIAELAEAGISSFKIEGRLKDDSYLKNITAFYRKKIDAFLNINASYTKTSSGETIFDFEPAPLKSFSRGATTYFLYKRSPEITGFETPKSKGEFVGAVKKARGKTLEIELQMPLSNNDGLTFFDDIGDLKGMKVNSANGNTITLAEQTGLETGTKIYRNYDHKFTEQLKNSRTMRKISLGLTVEETENGLQITGRDEDGIIFRKEYDLEKVAAQNPQKSETTLREQLGKSGDSVFAVNSVALAWRQPFFLPISKINEIRRDFLAAFEEERAKKHPASKPFVHNRNSKFPAGSVDYSENIANRLARKFYREHGVQKISNALETEKNYAGKKLMTTKHCLKYQFGFCPKETAGRKTPLAEPLFLKDESRKLRLEFDCRQCCMYVFLEK